jgi:uncharacterized membrane protein
MADLRLPYIFLLVAMFLFNFLIFLTPYLASIGSDAAPSMYLAFAPTCHQLTSRSLCLFVSKANGGYSIGDCFESSAFSLSKVNKVEYPDRTGYKIPVCSRDVAIYLAMLIGFIILPFIQKIEGEDWPNKWILVAAAIPTAIDGTSQLIGLRESTNFLRLMTGAIIGIVLPFYILPMMNSLYIFILEKLDKEKKPKNKGDL